MRSKRQPVDKKKEFLLNLGVAGYVGLLIYDYGLGNVLFFSLAGLAFWSFIVVAAWIFFSLLHKIVS